MEKKRENYLVFKRAIANELLSQGFKLLEIIENRYDRKKSNFIFEATQELVDYMVALKNRNNK